MTARRHLLGTNRLGKSLPLLLALALAACGSGDEKKRPTPTVGFVIAKSSAVPLERVLNGRTVPFEESEVRPQVTGVIRSRAFEEGGYVRAGQPLYQIDASIYRAAYNQASANLAAATAAAEASAARAERFRPLAEMEAISKQDYIDAAADARKTRAAVAQTAAAVESARVNLRFTTVPAPISGRIGRSLSTVGALVSANQAQPLAVIQRLDPIFVDIQQSSADLLALRRSLASGSVQPGNTAVRLKLEDGSEYGYAGVIQFSEVMVNEATGTVTLRARFPNPQGQLLPGMFVKATFAQATDPNAFLVPIAAVQRDFGGDAIIYVVGKGDKVERRTVKADRTLGDNWVVTEGLRNGDKLITQGTANLKQGMPVKAVPASAPQKVAPRPSGKPGG